MVGPSVAAPDDPATAWARTSIEEFTALACGAAAGVTLRRGRLASRGSGPPLPGFQPCSSDELPTGFAAAWWTTVPLVEMEVYLAYLVLRLANAGGQIATTPSPNQPSQTRSCNVASRSSLGCAEHGSAATRWVCARADRRCGWRSRTSTGSGASTTTGMAAAGSPCPGAARVRPWRCLRLGGLPLTRSRQRAGIFPKRARGIGTELTCATTQCTTHCKSDTASGSVAPRFTAVDEGAWVAHGLSRTIGPARWSRRGERGHLRWPAHACGRAPAMELPPRVGLPSWRVLVVPTRRRPSPSIRPSH